MPKITKPPTFCRECKVRAVWCESKRNRCWWCETGQTKKVEK